MNDDQLLRYSRHLLLDDVGFEAQARLASAAALVVGAGGLGSPASLYLACAGVGTLWLADDDDVDLTNLQRQILHRMDTLGWQKTRSALRTLGAINPEVKVRPLPKLHGRALDEAVARVGVVIDGSDNFATRHDVNRACFQHGVPLVSGAAIRFDGQFALFDPRRADSPCYACLFPESDGADAVDCATMGVFAPLTGIVGTMQAAAALQILGEFGNVQAGQLTMVDARSLQFTSIVIPRNPDCPVCRERGQMLPDSNERPRATSGS